MDDYEKEYKGLVWFMENVPSDEEPLGSEIKGEIDNITVNSEYCDIQEGVNVEAEALNTRESTSSDPVEPESGHMDSNNRTQKYYIGKDGTKWKATAPSKNVRTRSENIITHWPGVRSIAKNAKSARDCFHLFINTGIIYDIVKCTNIKIRNISSDWKSSTNCNETSEVEIKALFGLLYLAGVFRNNHRLLEYLWNTDGTGMDVFRGTMNFRQFQFLLCCLRFDNMENREERIKIDKLAHIRAIVEHFLANCQAAYTPSEYLTIDEKLEMFRGRCSFQQYMPNKPAKYGIKVHALVDVRTHYLINIEVYVGKQPNGPFNVSNSRIDIVSRLVIPVSKTNRNITMDNWNTSYQLFENLLTDHKLTAVGTIRKNKRQIPGAFLNLSQRQIQSSMFGFQENYCLLSYVPKKEKNVLMLSSLHHDDAIEEGEKNLPEMVSFYNMTKCGVDVVDQLSSAYNVLRPSRCWPLTFFSLLNTAGINSQIIYRENNDGKVLQRRIFLKELGLELVSEHQKSRMANPRLPRELQGTIWKLRGEEEPVTKRVRKNTQGRCVVCPRHKDRKSKYHCKSCGVFLCLENVNIYCENCEKSDYE